jgi:hypothetical protein
MTIKMTIAAISLLASTPVLAHSWYDPECCDGRECRVYVNDVERLRDGSYRLGNGQVVPAAKVKVSQDEKYHLCRWDGAIHCFYAPASDQGAGPFFRQGPNHGASAAPMGGAAAGPVLRRKF